MLISFSALGCPVIRTSWINEQLNRAVTCVGGFPYYLWNVYWQRGGGQPEIEDGWYDQEVAFQELKASGGSKHKIYSKLLRCHSEDVDKGGKTESAHEKPKIKSQERIACDDIEIKHDSALDAEFMLVATGKVKLDKLGFAVLMWRVDKAKMFDKPAATVANEMMARTAHLARFNYFLRHGEESSAEAEYPGYWTWRAKNAGLSNSQLDRMEELRSGTREEICETIVPIFFRFGKKITENDVDLLLKLYSHMRGNLAEVTEYYVKISKTNQYNPSEERKPASQMIDEFGQLHGKFPNASDEEIKCALAYDVPALLSIKESESYMPSLYACVRSGVIEGLVRKVGRENGFPDIDLIPQQCGPTCDCFFCDN
ncbi:hypothetical protein IWQ51_002081 [Labrenzia sp. EL_142]|nr:hypothetical protein [Labrenzia sp. EL_142]